MNLIEVHIPFSGNENKLTLVSVNINGFHEYYDDKTGVTKYEILANNQVFGVSSGEFGRVKQLVREIAK
jgi:hypothetical protein